MKITLNCQQSFLGDVYQTTVVLSQESKHFWLTLLVMVPEIEAEVKNDGVFFLVYIVDRCYIPVANREEIRTRLLSLH